MRRGEKFDRVLESPREQMLVAVEWDDAALFQLGARRQVKAMDRVEEKQCADTLVEIARFAAECVERVAFREELRERRGGAEVVERTVAHRRVGRGDECEQ